MIYGFAAITPSFHAPQEGEEAGGLEFHSSYLANSFANFYFIFLIVINYTSEVINY